MKWLPLWIIPVLMAAAGWLPAQVSVAVDVPLRQLTPGTDPELQLEALRAIATSLDPRIPSACLPMLQSTGTSVRRNAARAIGSRWWQIPGDQLPAYVQALRTNLRSGDVPLANMTRRGIGLLTHSYDGDMFSRSRSKRWIIYERHGKPCVIDSRNHTEELLGVDIEGKFLPAYGNDALTGHCHWHPKLDMVALDMVIFRRPGLLWIWRPAGGLRAFGVEELAKILQPALGELSGSAIQHVGFKEWKGTGLEFTTNYRTGHNEVSQEQTALLRWEAATNTLRVLSVRAAE